MAADCDGDTGLMARIRLISRLNKKGAGRCL